MRVQVLLETCELHGRNGAAHGGETMMKIAKRSHAASGLFFDASLGALACLTAACSLNVSGGDKTPDTFPIEGAPSGPNYLPDAATIEEDTAIISIIPVPDASTSEPPPGGADAGPGGPAPSVERAPAHLWRRYCLDHRRHA